ncbi:MAG: PAS domain S-box protein [Spirochaetes bacterium]|nr:PAS domain S-box protein [Spirochaetota bacterium]
MAELNNYTPNIMIVTIDPEINNILEVLLKNLNYKIQLTNSSSGAVKKLNEKKYDLVLLDVGLQGMNIIQFLNYVKEVSPETFVIVLAGHTSKDQIVECLNNGAYDFLAKPFEKEEIIKRIKNALDQKKLKNELEQARRKLLSLDKQYEYIVENSPDFVYSLDEHGNFIYINDSLIRKLGYSKNDIIGSHYSDVIHPEDTENAQFVFNERRAGSRDARVTKLRLKVNSDSKAENESKYLVVELKAKGIYDKSVKDKNKKFIGTHGIARDISVNLQLEESLKLQKTYFRQLFNNLPEAIAILDSQDRVIDVNSRFEKLFQYSISEIRNNSIHKFIVPRNLQKESKLISSSAISYGTHETESIRVCKDGKAIDVTIFAYPVIYNNKSIAIYHIYRDLSEFKESELELDKTLRKLRKAMGGIINAMVATVEVRDPYTAGHQQRVADLARAIAQEMGLPENEIDGIRMAGTLHDLGKVNIPAEILSKPGKLSDIEFSLIKMHPRVAYDILKEIDFPWPIADIVHQHHERIDGSGYPQGLKGKEILLSGRILTVADVVESIASHRPYRPALGIDKALEEINVKRGIYYDSEVVDACTKLFHENRFVFTDDMSARKETLNLIC